MIYRQVIANNGITFPLTLPKTIMTSDEMTDSQFASIIEKGLIQAKSDEALSAEEVFADLRKKV